MHVWEDDTGMEIEDETQPHICVTLAGYPAPFFVVFLQIFMVVSFTAFSGLGVFFHLNLLSFCTLLVSFHLIILSLLFQRLFLLADR